jgi:ubiquinone/menaquinone biosynthesis C-methylase UbiE
MDGVLGKSYAKDRLNKRYLEFRYKERALVASWATKKYGTSRPILKLVDFGAAEGLTLLEMRRLIQKKGEYIGVEYNQSLINCAPKLPEDIKLIRGDVTDIRNIGDNSIDVVTALAVLEH